MEFLHLFFSTVTFRPYVFLFLFVYVIAATKHLGFLKSLIFLVLGYWVAWGSEFSSVHTGFPYGLYRYINTTAQKELWVMGVPFMDSLSYVFLSYASFATARVMLGCFCRNRKGSLVFIRQRRFPVIFVMFGSFLFTFLDVIIDPIALRGDRWFLGKIYEYPHGGAYFGVPISNFVGWFAVGVVLVGILTLLDTDDIVEVKGVGKIVSLFLGPALYMGILSFNLVITAIVAERLLLIVDMLLLTVFLLLMILWVWNKHSIREEFFRCDRF